MFLTILKKDLKRKKAMNIVLFVLITLASTLVASSSSLMYSTSTAINSFIEHSKVADFNITLANSPEYNHDIEVWAKSDKNISKSYSDLQIGLLSKEIRMPEGRKSIAGNIGLVLSKVPAEVNLVFGADDERFTLQKGEIALPMSIQNATGLKLGDKVAIELKGITKTFTVTVFFKDAFMGSDLLSLKRMMIAAEDFADIQKVLPGESLSRQWSFTAVPGTNSAMLSADFSKEDLPINFEIEKALVKTSFLTDQIISAMLFVISVFLIFIAFLTLRFTIISTLQDDYKEIGVMKAIGFKSSGIRGLYLAKYSGLAVAGCTAGFCISLPLTELMSRKISQYIIVPGGIAGMLVSIASAVVIVAVTLLFCSMCMRKINKASPIDAIRQGHTGERFKASRKIYLHKSKALPTAMFLALSDVLNRLKSYTALILTFILSTAIIIIPINLTNTIVTPKFIGYFGTTVADFYTKSEIIEKPVTEVQSELAQLTADFRDKGIPVSLSADYTINTKYISDDGLSNRRISGTKTEPSTDSPYLKGVAPKLKNEIAITSIMSKNFQKGLGENIEMEIDGIRNTFLITGIFQTITNEGYMVRLADDFTPLQVAAYQYAGNIKLPEDQKAAVIHEVKQQFSGLEIMSASDLLSVTTGGFMGQLKNINTLLTVVMCLITFFITSLFVRLLITKEVQGIALMKSLGFTNGEIRVWQVLRILILMLGSVILGVLLANHLGEVLIGLIFSMFGLTEINFNIVPLQVYGLYPLLILVVVVLAVYSSCGQIRKIQVWNMNQE
ncbi:ABC transporter permease [Paenibacillus sp. FSL L8-0463]|uniref:ABC transporter permease n=1 Tax=Paenibacillus sp. FSL L8-0463 TaxID=2954687 RepID=UPI0031192D7D